MARTTALALLVLASSQAAAQHAEYRVEWPLARQHQLAGRWTGTLRDFTCDEMTADLTLTATHRYTLEIACRRPASGKRSMQGVWWVDEIAGSCLILAEAVDPTEKMFGFRIDGGGAMLQLDGGGCTAADPLDDGHVLRRVSQ